MDILLGDGSGGRVPELGRNAGGRQFRTGAELNAFLTQINAQGALNGNLMLPFPMVSPNARFNDTFNSFDLRLAQRVPPQRALPPASHRRGLQPVQQEQYPRIEQLQLLRLLQCSGS